MGNLPLFSRGDDQTFEEASGQKQTHHVSNQEGGSEITRHEMETNEVPLHSPLGRGHASVWGAS